MQLQSNIHSAWYLMFKLNDYGPSFDQSYLIKFSIENNNSIVCSYESYTNDDLQGKRKDKVLLTVIIGLLTKQYKIREHYQGLSQTDRLSRLQNGTILTVFMINLNVMFYFFFVFTSHTSCVIQFIIYVDIW